MNLGKYDVMWDDIGGRACVHERLGNGGYFCEISIGCLTRSNPTLDELKAAKEEAMRRGQVIADALNAATSPPAPS